MCGILGVATTRGRSLSVDAPTLERMRDVMQRRGPDGAGLWLHEHVALGHRRLTVVDPSAGRSAADAHAGWQARDHLQR
jgi:asparagine synthase (glutamine-hydrolysing)